MIFEGIYRRFIPLKGGKAPLDARMTHMESLAMGQVEPPGYELTRAGRRFYVGYNGTAPTGVVPVTAFPTTATQWTFWNGDLYKSYLFEALGAMLFAGTDAVGGTLLATIFQTPSQQGLAFATGLAVMSASGSAIGSKMIVKGTVTITGPAVPIWTPIADESLSAVATLPSSSIINRSLGGRLIVPPQSGLGLVVLAPTGTGRAFLPVGEWVEVESDLE